jgi:DNA-directed RNA polymerase subunit RPC12/RpoP
MKGIVEVLKIFCSDCGSEISWDSVTGTEHFGIITNLRITVPGKCPKCGGKAMREMITDSTITID